MGRRRRLSILKDGRRPRDKEPGGCGNWRKDSARFGAETEGDVGSGTLGLPKCPSLYSSLKIRTAPSGPWCIRGPKAPRTEASRRPRPTVAPSFLPNHLHLSRLPVELAGHLRFCRHHLRRQERTGKLQLKILRGLPIAFSYFLNV